MNREENVPLKQRMARGERLLGILVRTPATMLIDMAGHNGYDFVLLDTEHGFADQQVLADHVVAARAVGLPTIVRIGGGEAALALRVLDAGAEGIVVPHVQSAEQAVDAVRAAHYPPLGDRGFATYTPAGRWGKAAGSEHAADAARRTVVVAMVEDAQGVENAGAIAGTEGVDALWVGLSDLGATLGYDAGAADVACRQVWAAAQEAGAPVLALASDAKGVGAAFDSGAQLVVLNAQAAIDRCLGDWAQAGATYISHPNESHPNESHPNESHPNESHPNESHPNESHPNESHRTSPTRTRARNVNG
ncbi:HpcH/HpaI aldolase family protein [Nocardioides panzhihuensis]|uniref:4-hydroxy-2-oxoheptanedioate aldolase n=1 Tax=Nocardioides panzhihuensis TaxID=860243 RepID=A0A7Z0DP27_9ACTN|nr:aldolase/citrate lyase family protein [Nocardioides panzhihuensis]NYI78913.1 4-hydroxy-2-oxoheptanedioate aldolase [Nocardioides panzhihuensis]